MAVVTDKVGDTDLTVAIGNHDAFPNGQWDFTTEGPSLYDEYKRWVPESEWARWDKHGYYTKDWPELNTRVLALNTETCDFHNLGLWNELADPNDGIKFIQENLDELEKKGWHAVLLGHIPDECSHQYTERFRALMDRYQNTVRFNMFGHVH